jgi:hypothetical protein
MAYTDPEPEDDSKPLGFGGWLVLAALVALLVAAGVFAAQTWSSFSDVRMSTAGWIFLILGIVVSFLVGAGLMGLVFYSSRKKYDR